MRVHRDRARRVFLAGLVVAAFAVSGCAAVATREPSLAPSPTVAASQAPALVVPEALRGTYTATVVGTTASEGLWTLQLTDSDVLITNPIGGDAFSVDPTAISETSLTVKASTECPDQPTVTDGLYAISLDGDELTFTADHDSCGDRLAVLTTSTWTRSP